MNRIKWQQVELLSCLWLGYVGKVLMFEIHTLNNHCGVEFRVGGHDIKHYTCLKNAKRGAERTLARWLKDAGLEVTRERGAAFFLQQGFLDTSFLQGFLNTSNQANTTTTAHKWGKNE